MFLSFWEYAPPPHPFMPPPPTYEYGPLLRDDWGIDVATERRVIRGVVDRQHPGRYGISLSNWVHMQLSDFNEDHAIGKPLRARRMLMTDVCPVVRSETVPEGVNIEVVLEVPAEAHASWAEKDIRQIIQALQTGENNATFTPGEDAWKPPFSVMLTADKQEANSKIVVMGSAMTLLDDLLTRRVMRVEGKQQRLVTDPPPIENVDLLINSVYWLCEREDLIAAGPADTPVIGPISHSQKIFLGVVSFGWAAVVLIFGGFVMMVRRK